MQIFLPNKLIIKVYNFLEKQNELFGDEDIEDEPKKEYCGDNYIHADRFFLVASPGIFLIFNLVYWFSYGSQFYLADLDFNEDPSG